MPENANGPLCGLPDWIRLSDPSSDGAGFGELIVRILLRLESEYPDRVDLSDCDNLRQRQAEFTKIWLWLERQHVVSGPVSNCSLTLAGAKAYRTTVEQASAATKTRRNSPEGLKRKEAMRFIVDVLRHCHDNTVRR